QHAASAARSRGRGRACRRPRGGASPSWRPRASRLAAADLEASGPPGPPTCTPPLSRVARVDSTAPPAAHRSAARCSRRPPPPAVSPPGASPTPGAVLASRLLPDLCEGHPDVPQFLPVRRHVQDERAIAGREVSRELGRDLLVAPDQVRAHGLVVLEGDEPVWSARLAKRGQLPVPDRIRHLHGELMGELADSVLRE